MTLLDFKQQVYSGNYNSPSIVETDKEDLPVGSIFILKSKTGDDWFLKQFSVTEVYPNRTMKLEEDTFAPIRTIEDCPMTFREFEEAVYYGFYSSPSIVEMGEATLPVGAFFCLPWVTGYDIEFIGAP